MKIRARAVVVRLVQPALIARLSLMLCACTCPPPVSIDQVFLLDAQSGSFPDGGTRTMDPSTLDCTAAAAGCSPGGACKPACDCVTARDGITGIAAVDSCTLVAGAGPPAVEIKYQQTVFCGGD
jgi:hypothetical protein